MKKIQVFQDEDANFCVIVGTSDRVEAEKALRETEDEWYGVNHAEKPIPMDDFSKADIYCGTRKGEEDAHYGGNEPEKWFDNGKYETKEGFIANID